MQQIERVGVIALLLMVVTIVVVALWDDGGSAVDEEAAQAEEQAREAGPRPSERPEAQPRRPREEPVSRGQVGRDEPLRSTRAGTRKRTTAPLDPSVHSGDTTSAETRRAETSRLNPRRESGQRSRRDEERTRLSIPEQDARSGRVTEGIEFGPRRRNETRQQPRTDPERRGHTTRTEPLAQSQAPRVTPTVRAQPASSRTAQEPRPSGSRTYVVKAGDSLERIARRELGEGARWRELQALNGGVDPLKLHVGRKLVLPGGEGQPAPKKPTGPQPKPERKKKSKAATDGRIYVVKAGDILGRIAQRELGSSRHWRKILDANPKLNPDRLFVGAKIVLPEVDGAPEEERRLVAKADRPVDNTYRVR
ncbi:MAG: LysM peptidoglycan-binding domain-containing protein [bacterium]|nr:LysM peptidoglycan-binding domain-containing protein [bacterium]